MLITKVNFEGKRTRVPYSLNQTLQLLFISSLNFVGLLFESGYYLRAAFIKLGTEDEEKSTASSKVEWLQTPGSQSEETLPL